MANLISGAHLIHPPGERGLGETRYKRSETLGMKFSNGGYLTKLLVLNNDFILKDLIND